MGLPAAGVAPPPGKNGVLAGKVTGADSPSGFGVGVSSKTGVGAGPGGGSGVGPTRESGGSVGRGALASATMAEIVAPRACGDSVYRGAGDGVGVGVGVGFGVIVGVAEAADAPGDGVEVVPGFAVVRGVGRRLETVPSPFPRMSLPPRGSTTGSPDTQPTIAIAIATTTEAIRHSVDLIAESSFREGLIP